jgi:type III secretory pathway component EscT
MPPIQIRILNSIVMGLLVGFCFHEPFWGVAAAALTYFVLVLMGMRRGE